MIRLLADSELKMTFDRMIETMEAPVKWTGQFIVQDNYLILEGELRSLFMNLEKREILSNVIEIPESDKLPETAQGKNVKNVINMLLYVFGKWGRIKGLRVDRKESELLNLFNGIVAPMKFETEYSSVKIAFYQHGLKATYEDLVAGAIALDKAKEEENETDETKEERKDNPGLWRDIVWKSSSYVIDHENIERAEKGRARIGHNFYLSGYVCPECKGKLQMVVFPEKAQVVIDTEEGRVKIARALTCSSCKRFITAKPFKLLMDPENYTISFAENDGAYEDYLALLGQQGSLCSNYNYNVFLDEKLNKKKLEDPETIEEIAKNLPQMPEKEIKRLEDKLAEGFFEELDSQIIEEKIREELKDRSEETEESPVKDSADSKLRKAENSTETEKEENLRKDSEEEKRKTENVLSEKGRTSYHENKAAALNKKDRGVAEEAKTYSDENNMAASSENKAVSSENKAASDEKAKAISDEKALKYRKKISAISRFSDRQISELERDVKEDRELIEEERRHLEKEIADAVEIRKISNLSKKAEAALKSNYVVLKRTIAEIEEADIPKAEKEKMLPKLKEASKQKAEREATLLWEKRPKSMTRQQLRKLADDLKQFEDADLTPYLSNLEPMLLEAEKYEIATLAKEAPKRTSKDCRELKKKIEEMDFLPELAEAYLEKLDERIRSLDKKAIDFLLPDLDLMSFDEGIEALEKIEMGDFLPDLKIDAVEILSKKLKRMKLDECQLLVMKMQAEAKEAGLKYNERHHFYPANAVEGDKKAEEEKEICDRAVRIYAVGIGKFEYPLFVCDSTKNGSAKEGFILTPEKLYYSSLMTTFSVKIDEIEKAYAQTGIIGKGLFLLLKNGDKLKIPYAVESKELPKFSDALNRFITYLKDKPDSRNVSYLSKESRNEIHCYRCGFVFKEGTVCPKCGCDNSNI